MHPFNIYMLEFFFFFILVNRQKIYKLSLINICAYIIYTYIYLFIIYHEYRNSYFNLCNYGRNKRKTEPV